MLKTWITGTKDFTDQGLAPSEWTNDNVTIVDGGKLGKCMYFNGTSSRLSTTGYTLSNKWSWACWVKEDPSVTAWQLVLMLNTSGSDADSQTALWLKANEHRFEVCNNAKYNSTIQYTQGQWNHYAMSFDGTTTKAYLNGSQVATFTSSTIFSKTNLTIGAMGTNVSGGHVSASYYLKGYINDLRIWDDEVISPLQVKRLSQGLVLHYPLSRNGMGPDNLIPNSLTYSGWSINSLWTQSTSNGEIIWSASRTGATSYLWNRIIPPTQFNPNNYPNGITVSFDFKCDDINALDHKCICALQIYKSDGTRIGWYESKNSFTETNYIGSSTLQNGQWKRLSCYFTQGAMQVISTGSYTVADVSYTTVSFQLVKNGSISIKKIKIEEGNHVSPYSISSQDDSVIEYDTSGFGNNGIRVGEFSWSTDTPRYLASTQFSGSQYIRLPLTCGTISEAVTIACWGYEDNWNTSSAERLIGAATSSSGWCIGDYGSENTLFAFYANGSYNGTSGFKQLSSGWHHFVMIFDGLNLICYVDGEQVSKKTFSAKQVATGNYNIEIGRHYGGSYNFKGRMSDVRIYATALSAEDILSLYQASAYIDSQGNTYASSYVEG